MKYLLIVLSLFFLSDLCLGQVTYYSKRYYIDQNLRPFDFVLNEENGTIVVGKNNIYNSFCSYQNEDGTPVWSKRFIPQQGYIELNNVIRLHDSTFFLVGTMKNPNTGKYGAACIRMNQYGDTIWAKTIDHFSLETIPHDVIQLKDSNLLVTGSIHGAWSFAFKLDLDGNKIWGKTYVFNGAQINWTNEIIAVKEHDNGQFTFAGRSIDQNAGTAGRRGFVMKTESNGEDVWVKSLYRSGEYVHLDDVIIQDSFYYFLNSASSDLIKTDSSLNPIWCSNVAGPNQFYDEKRSVTILHDSTLLVTWHEMFEGHIQRIDPYGNVIDAATIVGQSIRTIQDKDSSILILNEGPVYGVKSVISQKHFGVYKLDSLLNSPWCVYENTTWGNFNSMNVSSSSLVWQDEMDIFNTAFEMEDLILIYDEDCVDSEGGINEEKLNNFEAFPNPFLNEISIHKTNPQVEEFLICDLLGRILMKGSISGLESKLNMKNLSSGNYIIYIGDSTKKVLKY